MKILVFSDSHGYTMRMIDIIENEKPDMLFHLGDIVGDTVDLRAVFPDIPLINVCGNNDFMSDAPLEEFVEVCGTRFFLTHGHLYSVRRQADALAKRAKQMNCNVALYGHTHVAVIETCCGIITANPGSISLPYGSLPSYLEINAENGKSPKMELKYVEKQDNRPPKTRIWNRFKKK